MFWKLIIGISIIACIVGGVIWISHGMEIYTKDREKVVTVIKDEVFGTTREEVSWKPTFKYGLLPDDANFMALPRSYGFVLGLSFAAIIGSAIMLKRSRS
ncbi:MAG: hypothetical protein EHM43_05145 [Ignavibacteriae bacterium]|nr:MAG: hypothetical protein EHM43_05145 [Ignavibacteriota bacterium]